MPLGFIRDSLTVDERRRLSKTSPTFGRACALLEGDALGLTHQTVDWSLIGLDALRNNLLEAVSDFSSRLLGPAAASAADSLVSRALVTKRHGRSEISYRLGDLIIAAAAGRSGGIILSRPARVLSWEPREEDLSSFEYIAHLRLVGIDKTLKISRVGRLELDKVSIMPSALDGPQEVEVSRFVSSNLGPQTFELIERSRMRSLTLRQTLGTVDFTTGAFPALRIMRLVHVDLNAKCLSQPFDYRFPSLERIEFAFVIGRDMLGNNLPLQIVSTTLISLDAEATRIATIIAPRLRRLKLVSSFVNSIFSNELRQVQTTMDAGIGGFRNTSRTNFFESLQLQPAVVRMARAPPQWVSLRRLQLHFCQGIRVIDLSRLPKLDSVIIRNCPVLTVVAGIAVLHEVTMDNCPLLKSVNRSGMSNNGVEWSIRDCPLLELQ